MSKPLPPKLTGYLLTTFGAVVILLNLTVFDNSRLELPLVVVALLLVGMGFVMIGRPKK